MRKVQGEVVLQNKDFKLIKVSEDKHVLCDSDNNKLLGLNGGTKEELEEHFNNFHKCF